MWAGGNELVHKAGAVSERRGGPRPTAPQVRTLRLLAVAAVEDGAHRGQAEGAREHAGHKDRQNRGVGGSLEDEGADADHDGDRRDGEAREAVLCHLEGRARLGGSMHSARRGMAWV